MMLSTDRSRRPSTEELLVHPPILYRIRERKINQHYAALKKKEDELVAKVVRFYYFYFICFCFYFCFYFYFYF